jgi:hypothetical protein
MATCLYSLLWCFFFIGITVKGFDILLSWQIEWVEPMPSPEKVPTKSNSQVVVLTN